MYQDRDEALQKLSAELLEEEETQPPVRREAPVVYRNYANNYGRDLRNFASDYSAYNSDPTDEDPQELADEILEEPKRELLWPFVAINVLLLGGILGVLAYWVFGLGILG